ncbi:MAG: efflux RND transporter periplasmic adaptor subunit [Muribaculaceae bacterium]|nr:efflux RND transporter periplasmic adaptor subunit [Muribaculaceae bacterium]
MKKEKYIIILIIATLFAGCKKNLPVNIETVEVETGDLSETVTATGTVESVTQVDVGTQVTGIIDKLYADYNSVVKKGELIAEIEKTLLASDLKSAEANVESAKITYEYNLTNYKRDKALHDKQLISDLEYQTSLKEMQVSKQNYDKATADRVRAAKNLNYAEIYSPIDGIVISRDVEVGQTVVSSMNVANLFTIADLDNMQIVGNVDEADIGQVKVGQKVTFSVDAYADELFEGSVTQVRLSPTTENNVVTYEVIVAAPNPEHKLIPGLTANLTIYVMNEPGVMLLPVSSFRFDPSKENIASMDKNLKIGQPVKRQLASDEKSVWVLSGNNLTNKIVKTGETNGIQTAILSGLKKGEKVAIGIEEGAAIRGENSGEKKSPFAPGPPGKKK